ncbi:MAG TPA: hypothetical protein VGC14_02000, partial [Rhizobium sp.]
NKQKGRNKPAFRHPSSHQCQYIRGQRERRNRSQIDCERLTHGQRHFRNIQRMQGARFEARHAFIGCMTEAYIGWECGNFKVNEMKASVSREIISKPS